MSELLLVLHRHDGREVSINAGVISSCEEGADGHGSVIVTGGVDGDVYYVTESYATVKAKLSSFLRDMIRNRLKAMEADPSWASTFQAAIRELVREFRNSTATHNDLKEAVVDIYQSLAARYCQDDIDRQRTFYAKAKEVYDMIYGDKTNDAASDAVPSTYSYNCVPVQFDRVTFDEVEYIYNHTTDSYSTLHLI